MSSNCSINCCSSPEITSSNVSVSNMNGVISNDTAAGRVRTTVPDTKKDNKYWERRRRNNEAARRSREKRRQNDMVMDKRILELSQRNKQLENELFQLKMNFGIVNNNPSKLELEDQNGKLISPSAISESGNNLPNSTDHINGMVFPVFTAFSPGTETTDVLDKTNSDIVSKSNVTTSKTNDGSKTCMTANKYPSTVINFSNIPFLTSRISTPNFNEDITSKATLLLPALASKTPTKPIDSGPSSSVFNTNIDGLTFNNTPSIVNDFKKRSDSIDLFQNSLSETHIKLDLHDILDLSLKQDNNECFFINADGSSHVFRRQIDSDGIFDADSKEAESRSTPEIQPIKESRTNSFLSGILSATPEDPLSISVKRKSLIDVSSTNRLHNNRIRRCNLFNNNAIISKYRNPQQCHLNAIRHHLDLKTRLLIRREVSTIVVNENRKIRHDIDCLSREIKLLKSTMLECAKLSVNQPISDHDPSLQDPQHVNFLSDDIDGIFVQCPP